MPPALPTCLLCLAACALQPPEDAGRARPAAPPPEIQLEDVTFVHSRGDAVFARGHLDAAAYERGSGNTRAKGASLRFPREDRPGTAVTVTAPTATGNPLEARVSGAGGVRAENAQGDVGLTERASYDGRAGRAEGDRPVTLLGPGFTARSPGFHWRERDDTLDLGPGSVVTRGRSP